MTPNVPEHIGPYQVLELLGKGGMGSVFKAMQPSLNRLVAIKVLPREFAQDPERVERFHREAQAVALLNHPNIVHIIDKDQDGDTLYFVMEYVEGTSLGVVLFQRRLSLSEALLVAKNVARALEYAHRHKVVHRDLKPGNVLVSSDLSVVKLADFGISRIDPGGDTRTLTTTQTSLGTLHYCAPEQIENPKAIDHRVDLYSLGVICYEMLTGRVPLGKFRLPSQLNTQLPPELDRIVLKCLASEPDDRYPSATELLADIDELEKTTGFRLVAELKLLSQSTSRLIRTSTTRVARQRKASVYAMGGLAVVALVAVGALFALRSRSGVPLPESETVLTEQQAMPQVPSATPAPAAAASLQPTTSPVSGSVQPSPSLAAPTPTTAAPHPTAAGDTGARATTGAASPTPQPAAKPEPPAPAAPRAAQRRADALKALSVARTKADAGLFDQALADIKAVLSDPGAASVTSDAYLTQAYVHERQGRLDDARAALVEMTERFGNDPRVGEALLQLAQLTLRGRDGEKNARAILAQMIERLPASPSLLPALMEKARLEQRLRLNERDPVLQVSVPSAFLTYRMVTEKFPDRPEAETAFWQVGDTLDDLKQYEAAAQAFVNLGTRFQQTKMDAWWRAGELYERRLKNIEQARAAYERVPPTSSKHRDAQRRLERIR